MRSGTSGAFLVFSAVLLAAGLGACSGSGPGGSDAAPAHGVAMSDADRRVLAEARAALDDNDHDRARILLRPLALRGLAEAQGLLGSSYSNNLSLFNDTPADGPIQEAHYWLSRAAAQGDARGQAGLGSIMLLWPEQLGLASSEKEALEWLEKSAHQGNTDAMGLLTLAYRNLESHRDLGRVEYWQAELDKISAAADRQPEQGVSPVAEADSAITRRVTDLVSGDQASDAQTATAGQASIAAAFRDAHQDADRASAASQEPTEKSDVKLRANALVAQSNEHLKLARAAASDSKADDVRAAVLDSGARVVPAGNGALSIYRPDGRLVEVRLPEDVTVGFQESGDVHVLSSGGTVHFLANGRACHANLEGMQVRYHPDGSSTVAMDHTE